MRSRSGSRQMQSVYRRENKILRRRSLVRRKAFGTLWLSDQMSRAHSLDRSPMSSVLFFRIRGIRVRPSVWLGLPDRGESMRTELGFHQDGSTHKSFFRGRERFFQCRRSRSLTCRSDRTGCRLGARFGKPSRCRRRCSSLRRFAVPQRLAV